MGKSTKSVKDQCGEDFGKASYVKMIGSQEHSFKSPSLVEIRGRKKKACSIR